MGLLGTALALSTALACSDDDGGGEDDDDDADADGDDAAPPDAGGPDAFTPCPGELTFTGEYLDWVTDTPIFDATLTDAADPSNTAATAPNGRGVLCLARDVDADVRFEHADYLTLLHAVDAADAASHGTFFSAALTPADADALYADELFLARAGGAATVIVDIRTYPGGAPAAGAEASLQSAHTGAFTHDGSGTFAAGATVGDDPIVLFTNVAIGDGSVTVEVTPPPDAPSCAGRVVVPVAAGGISFAPWSCE
jgi:hypothetical protein